ncbi:MAG: hypothetical protein ACSW8F_04325 [bacterium]
MAVVPIPSLPLPFLPQKGGEAQPPEKSPVKLSLVVTIVEKSKQSFYTDLIQTFDANLQLTMIAKGTADASVLRMLGISDYDQRAILSIVRSDRVPELMEALEKRFRSIKGGKGVAFSVPFSSMIGKLAFGFLSNEERMVQNG